MRSLGRIRTEEFSRLDDRGLADHLADHPDLAREIELEVVPHFTTFDEAAARLHRAGPCSTPCSTGRRATRSASDESRWRPATAPGRRAGGPARRPVPREATVSAKQAGRKKSG